MTKEKPNASANRQCHARGVSLIKPFDKAKTTIKQNQVGVPNGECKTLRESKTSIFLSEPKTY